MARTPKPIGNTHSLSRKPPKLEPLHGIYIYCEGSITEPEYIRAYYRDFCTKKKVVLFAIKGGEGAPKTLVDKCVQKFQELKKSAKHDSFEKNTSIWAVFDIDEHEGIEEAVRIAEKIGIEVAISNPCFEVFGLMHKSVYDRPLSRTQAQSLLAEVMPGYHHKHAPSFVWSWCRDQVEQAMHHSALAVERRNNEGSNFLSGNPSSDFHRLLQALNPHEE